MNVGAAVDVLRTGRLRSTAKGRQWTRIEEEFSTLIIPVCFEFANCERAEFVGNDKA